MTSLNLSQAETNMNALEAIQLDVLDLTNQEIYSIDGGLEAPSTRTVIIGTAITVLGGPILGGFFWLGYYVNQ